MIVLLCSPQIWCKSLPTLRIVISKDRGCGSVEFVRWCTMGLVINARDLPRIAMHRNCHLFSYRFLSGFFILASIKLLFYVTIVFNFKVRTKHKLFKRHHVTVFLFNRFHK